MRRVLVTISLAVVCLAATTPLVAAAPGTPVFSDSVSDCSGEGAQEYNNGSPFCAQGCQSYNADLYENLDYDTSNDPDAVCADIEVFNLGSDGTWLYLEWDMAGAWTNSCSSLQLGVEFDIDTLTERGGTGQGEGPRGDYYITGTSNGCKGGNGDTWKDAFNTLGWTGWSDGNDDAGDGDPRTGDTTCTACPDPSGNADGYNTDLSEGTDNVYCRNPTANPDRLQVAVKRSYLSGLTNPVDSDVRIRGWSNQTSSLPADKMYWHDEQVCTDLGGARIDNVDWNGSVVTAVKLLALTATSGKNVLSTSTFLALGLVCLVATGLIGLSRRL